MTIRTKLLIPRRKALLGAAGLAALPFAAPHVARAADPIKIGLLLGKTGQIAGQTEYLANGSMLALEQRNGTIMGQPAELVWLDEPSPQGATQNMQKLVQENKVCAVLGGALSSNALAEEAKAAELKIPFVCDNAAATDITGKNCNRYTFRLNTPVAVQCRMLAPYALKYGKRWYHITASFAFGQDILKSSRELLKAAGGTEVGVDEVPLNTADFSSFILKIRQAKPDVVCSNLAGNQVTTLIKQYAEFGLPYPIVGFNLNTADAWAAGDGNLSGTWPTDWYHTLDVPASKVFVANFIKKYSKPPENHAWIEYVAFKMMAQAMNATKSTDTDPLIGYFEKETQFDILKRRKAYFRSWDHQLMQEAYPFTVKAKGQSKDKWDTLELGAAVPAPNEPLESISLTKEQNPCSM